MHLGATNVSQKFKSIQITKKLSVKVELRNGIIGKSIFFKFTSYKKFRQTLFVTCKIQEQYNIVSYLYK